MKQLKDSRVRTLGSQMLDPTRPDHTLTFAQLNCLESKQFDFSYYCFLFTKDMCKPWGKTHQVLLDITKAYFSPKRCGSPWGRALPRLKPPRLLELESCHSGLMHSPQPSSCEPEGE